MSETGGAELNYQLLESSSTSRGGAYRTSPSGVAVSAGPVLYALARDDSRHLLVPLGINDLAVKDTESAGVHITVRTLVESGSVESRYVNIECLRPDFHRLFSHVVDELLAHLDVDSSEPGPTCLQVLERWRELFGRQRGRHLAEEQVIGLMGELLFLERIASSSPVAAMNSWTGWEKEKVDFFAPGVAVEVKSTIAREGRSTVIHGLSQLEPDSGSTLTLLLTRLSRIGSNRDSVPDVINRLISLGVNSTELSRRLMLIGYLPEDREYYDTLRFTPVEVLAYLVGDDFPRLTPSGLKSSDHLARFSNVQYKLDLAGVGTESEEHLDSIVARMGCS